MSRSSRQLPVALKEGLLVETLPDEVLVYDLERKKAHCLNQTAALIWQHCDGRTSVSEIARALSNHLNASIDEEVVWYGLKHLDKSRLLEEEMWPGNLRHVSRRNLVRKIGVAISIPLVMSVLAPKASAVLSCTLANCPEGFGCTAPCKCNPDTSTCTGM